MAHHLHKKIGSILNGMQDIFGIEVILAPECIPEGRKGQVIPLFMENTISNKTKICNVDAMVEKNEKIKIIIEIDESGNIPTHICGKYFTSNLAKLCTYKCLGGRKERKIDKASVYFIQIIDDGNLPENSSKPDQFENIEKTINNLIVAAKDAKKDCGCIKKYILMQTHLKKDDSEREIEKEKTFLKEFEDNIKEGIN
jgi:hypothetical protein